MASGIIQSLFDLDYYKITMAQVAHRLYPELPVTYAFINRTKDAAVGDFVDLDELRAELEHVRSLSFTDDELDYLRESEFIPRGMFAETFLAFLRDLRLPEVSCDLDGARVQIETEGPWPVAIFWETLILSIVTELYCRGHLAQHGRRTDDAWAEGERRLSEKIARLRPERRVRFSDFGTRRRFSREWQRHLVGRLARELPEQFIGTSNVLFAKERGLRPIGTFAHEMHMVYSAIYHGSEDEIRASHAKVFDDWWEQYGEPLSIALSDTYGTAFFFRDFSPGRARAWRGLRQDSGDPFDFAERAIAFYESLGIDPRTKTIIFSDGLEVDKILRLVERFDGRVGVGFGWGTNLTNDVGIAPLSLIVKAVRACGHGTVKLSDNFDKALGEPGDVEHFLRIFGYRRAPPSLGVKY